MTERELDALAFEYLEALNRGDLDKVSEIWNMEEPEVWEMLYELHEELAREGIS